MNILTPNSLLLGRSASRNPGGYEASPSLRSRLTLVQQIVDQFWIQWTNLYAPTLIRQNKWLTQHRDLQVGDVVLVSDSGLKRGEYHLGRVTQALPGTDGRVRRVKVAYKNYKVGEKVHRYSGAPDADIERSVQNFVIALWLSDCRK